MKGAVLLWPRTGGCGHQQCNGTQRILHVSPAGKSARPTRVSARWPVCPTLSLAANPLRSLFSWAGVVGGSNRITVSVCIAYIYLGTFHALPCFWGQEKGVWRGFRAIFYVRLDRREWEEFINTKIVMICQAELFCKVTLSLKDRT